MSYKTILVNLDLDGPVEPVVKAAAELAGRLGARLVGHCAADAPMPMAGPEGTSLAAEVWMQMRNDIEVRMRELRGRFEALTGSAGPVEWRNALGNPSQALTESARMADLIVMAAAEGAATGDSYRRADPGSVALQAGRPLLVVAQGAERIPADNVVVAWKDTREARRAIADAVPILQTAGTVTVVTVVQEKSQWAEQGVTEIAAFLARHGVKARAEVLESADDSRRLVDFVTGNHADLVVSGAYGHSRFREWAFGGVTRSLLDEAGLNRFMSS